MKHYRYRCWGCDKRWGDYSDKPDRVSNCPFCGSSLTTFVSDEPSGLVAFSPGRLRYRLNALQSYVEDDNGCWIWQGDITPYGYSRLMINARRVPAHRFFYEFHIGPIPEGLQIDHLCRVRACVNPAHLECVTLVENVMRGESPQALNARKTHCINGHELTEDNVRLDRDGSKRVCRTCVAIAARRRGERLKAETRRMRDERNEERGQLSRVPTDKQRTHCANGHGMSGANVFVDVHGYWRCLACSRRRAAEYRARRDAA